MTWFSTTKRARLIVEPPKQESSLLDRLQSPYVRTENIFKIIVANNCCVELARFSPKGVQVIHGLSTLKTQSIKVHLVLGYLTSKRFQRFFVRVGKLGGIGEPFNLRICIPQHAFEELDLACF
ncbi:hypothetical protein BJ122_11728 [Rhodopseudomonas faecalis]|uniref:Uncharacterized protein n=1 Tax=Rhodopseudomonas faecalis TaxID=99655 RepID=A0A318TIZ0_9BRAD|nr:hypothetical protein BJ122_11728 [Rhodopseudomonas faecalis]